MAEEKYTKREKLFLGLLAVTVLIAIVLFITKNSAINKIEKETTAKIEQIKSSAEEQHIERAKGYLRLSMVPYVWAIRSELTRGNFDQADQYIAKFVRENGFSRISFVGVNGIINLSSDKKLEGTEAASIYNPGYNSQNEIGIVQVDGSSWQIVAPILGLDEKMGIVVLDYSYSPLVFE